MKNQITYITCFLLVALSFIGTAQNLDWYEINNLEQTNDNTLIGSGSAFSLQVLPQETANGYFEVTNFKINDANLSSFTGGQYDSVSIYLVKTNSNPLDSDNGTIFNTNLSTNNRYSITVSKTRGNTGTIGSFSVIARDLDGSIIGQIDNINPQTTDKIRIEKINTTQLHFLFNGQTVATVTDSNLSWNRAGYSNAVLSVFDDSNPPILSSMYSQQGFEITNDSYGPFRVNDTDKNWVSVNSYDSTGKFVGASVSYSDELGKGIQSQTFNPKNGKTWAIETQYDNQGRPALSTLSAPIGKLPSFSYKEGFIKKSDDTNFTVIDFDNNTPESPTEVGDQKNTLGWYYSQNNTDANGGNSYQDVTTRPYSRTIFSELNPGAALKTIGGNQIDNEWKQGYTFSMPAGEELTRTVAFGEIKYNSENYKIIKTVSRDVHGAEAAVFTDTDGKTLAAARSGNEDNNTASRTSKIDIGVQGFVDIHIPVGETSITITGASNAIEIYDLITEQIIDTPLNQLANGFYRIAVSDLDGYEANTISVTYPENYYDYSLNYYDKAGRLISSEQPLEKTDGTEEKLKSTFEYNALGQLTQTHSPDEGDAWFLYRKDGQIRFSINSKQWANKEFSYTNYDKLGRPKESGIYKDELQRYINDVIVIETVIKTTDPFKESLKTILDSNEENGGFPIVDRSEVHKTTYDYLKDEDIAALPVGYKNPSFLSGNVARTWNNQTTTYYSYDIYGRVQWIVQDIADLGTKTIDYEYDPITSQVTRVLYQKGQADQFIHKYTYDAIDYSLTKVETSTDDVTYTENAQYEYYETGALKTLNLADKLQEIDYVYNLNGALKSINQLELNDSNKDLFGMNIHYYKDDYKRTNTPKSVPTLDNGIDQYNGNIKAITWNTRREENQTTPGSYYYDYNKNNWLTGASFDTPISDGDPNVTPTVTRNTPQITTEDIEVSQVVTLGSGFSITANNNLSFSAKIVGGAVGVATNGDYNVSNITYDANGNIQSLDRNKNVYQGSNAMDKLAYTYKDGKPNQLKRVDDAVSSDTNADDIKDQINEENYIYNAIGQLIENKEEKITYIYNASGLVTQVAYDGIPVVKFFYNDKNHRVKKESYNETTGILNFTAHYVRDAAGTAMAIYRNGEASEYTIYGSSRLGVYNKDTGSSLYQLTDHLGNVRAVVGRTDTGQQMALTTATDYYPFGMPMPNRNLKGDYRYAYQGQEVDPETGKEAFEARLWDNRIGRWLTIDPAREFDSPYLGMANNPINTIDPDGRCTTCPENAKIGDTYNHSEYGNLTYGEQGWADASGANIMNDVMLSYSPANTDHPVVSVSIVNQPKGIETMEFLRALKQGLINNGFSENIQVRSSRAVDRGILSDIKRWWNDAPVTNLLIRDFDAWKDAGSRNAGGYAVPGSNRALVYNGLGPTARHRNSSFSIYNYVNASMHEIGHSTFSFMHDNKGHTNFPDGIMDYRSDRSSNNLQFSPQEIKQIKASVWGN